MTTLAYFGINNSGVNLAINLAILVVGVIYLSLVVWTFADARRRISDPMLVVCATIASFFPFIGTLVYLILRPPEYLADVQERALEMQAAEAQMHALNYQLCPHCDYLVERDFLRCPSCLHRLKEPCISCGRPLDPAWTICPYCENQVAPVPKTRLRRRRDPDEMTASEPLVGLPASPEDAAHGGASSRLRGK